MKKLFVIVFMALLLGGGAYLFLGTAQGLPSGPEFRGHLSSWLRQATDWLKSATASQAPAKYITAPVEKGDIRETVTATGTLNALVTVEVGSQLSGQISKLFVDFNDPVEKDQPIAQLDQRSFEARLAETAAATRMAEAAVEMHKSKVERARIDAKDAEAQLLVLKARVDNARFQVEAAERDLDRKQKLGKRGAVSVSQIEDSQTERDKAAATLREVEAVAAAQAHKIAGRAADLKTAEAELANAMASVPQKNALQRQAEIDLERTTIRSPIAGVVVGRDIDEGQTVAASLEAPKLFSIAGDLRNMEIHAKVDEADIGQIKVGQKAIFSVDARPGLRLPAVVTSIRKASKVVQNVVTYTVVLATENPDDILLPGMTATVRIVVGESKGVLKVPMAALRFSPRSEDLPKHKRSMTTPGERSAVIWVSENPVNIAPVDVVAGEDDGTSVAILKGDIKEGDQVVVGEVNPSRPKKLFGIRLGF